MKNSTLAKLKTGEHGIVKKIECNINLQRRLMDLGLIEDTDIECVHISPHGTPIAFNIRGAIIALRKSDCENIVIL